ncbi:hypothetical protein E8Q33_05085 [Methylophaga sp. SB9B]|uniref:hypothetical protein n=1 Tax=Methylophaga sp. SB9B TaxID=2570356 RepID=UPI0010A8002D|nr:hypothetical protein [Methylophaga sp. SB9B]THK42158.1 hypothetical protein E8Q33_05085 [Methylophaga sp. SB9B]
MSNQNQQAVAATIDLSSSENSESPIWDDQQAAFYLKGIEQSDYAEKVGASLLEAIGIQTNLLDIGAGVGSISRRILADHALWTAIEPNHFLASYLTSHAEKWPYQLSVMQSSWQRLTANEIKPHKTSLAANTSGPVYDTKSFWHWQRNYTTDLMIWIVPAQDGPRGKCLSGFLSPELHGEAVGSSLETIVDELDESMQPHQIFTVDWTFRQDFSTPEEANQYFQHNFNTTADPEKAQAISNYLTLHLKQEGKQFFASAAKKSAVLIWKFN